MKYKDVNDYEVLYLIGENEEDAKRIVYEKYKPIILSLAYKYYKILKHKGLELDDLIQEGYIGLNRAIERYSEQKDCLFYTFALLCIERQLQTVTRNASTLKQEILNHAISFDYEMPYTDMAISDVVEDEVMHDPIYQMIDLEYQTKLIEFQHNLPFVQARIFELRYNGFSYQEIGEFLELSKKSIDSHLVRIRKKLKACGLKVEPI